MTWTPETNRIIWCLMTPEEQAAMKAAKHGWEIRDDYGWIGCTTEPIWFTDTTYRAIPAPAVKPPVDPAIWRFLPKWVMHMAMDANLEWWGYKDKPERFEEFWYSKEGVHNLDQFVLPSTGFEWRDSCIARPKGM